MNTNLTQIPEMNERNDSSKILSKTASNPWVPVPIPSLRDKLQVIRIKKDEELKNQLPNIIAHDN